MKTELLLRKAVEMGFKKPRFYRKPQKSEF